LSASSISKSTNLTSLESINGFNAITHSSSYFLCGIIALFETLPELDFGPAGKRSQKSGNLKITELPVRNNTALSVKKSRKSCNLLAAETYLFNNYEYLISGKAFHGSAIMVFSRWTLIG